MSEPSNACETAVAYTQRLLAEAGDESTKQILLAIHQLAKAVELVRAENAAIQLQLENFARLLQERSPSTCHEAPDGGADGAPAAMRQTPQFKSSVSEYEVGELFENEPAYDLTLEFMDANSRDWYRVWNFADAGHALHAILESCARTTLAEQAAELTYRRDVTSVTVFATRREALDELLANLLAANATYDGALKLMESIRDPFSL